MMSRGAPLSESRVLSPDGLGTQGVARQALELMGKQGVEAGLGHLQRYVQDHPQDAQTHSMLLFFTHYLETHDRMQLAEAYRDWARRHMPVTRERRPFERDRDPLRRLRIGYLSPDFYAHTVMNHFKVLFSAADREHFEIYAYGSVRQPDAITERVAQYSDVYRSVYHWSDEQLAQCIEADDIDILVNLAGPVAGHRLGALAAKPAPIQIDFQGINTTGMEQIDVRVSDAYLDPEGEASPYVERTVRLPRCLMCFTPPYPCPDVGPLPYMRDDVLTFGSFNAAFKVNHSVVSLWARVLHEVAGSRLLLKLNASCAALNDRIRQWFEQEGIDSRRLEIQSQTVSHYDHLDLHNQFDIALDTYPFTGCVTTMEALWMGVPVISLAGDRYISRMGYSVLNYAGLGLFATESPSQFIAKAAALAANPEALASLRATLRPRLRQGLCDAQGYMRDLEAIYRRLWCQWCQDDG